MKIVKMFEEFVFEAFIDDPGVKASIAEFYDLQNEIKRMEAELEEKKLAFKQFEGEVKPMLDGMKEVGDKLAETEGFVIKVSRFGGERKDASYKTAFENALGKVNAATRRVLEEALEASKKVTQVKHSFSIDKVVVAEASIFDKIKNAIKGAINKLLGVFKKESKTIDDANKDLKKLV
jgi:septal ring factor EnvC (AmiA/AmiB activator)